MGPGEVVAEQLARCRFPEPGTAVDLAVSGGADSLALLVLADAGGLELTVHHVDHGLRPGSADEAAVVVAAAERFGARWRTHRVEVGEGSDLEARARRARYEVLPAGVLTGHTGDDQAETVLLRLLRGTGLDGLAAMEPDRHPLLALRRTDTEAVCVAADLAPLHDPSNTDPRFRRNRVRHELLPLMHDVAGRDVVPLLVRMASVCRSDMVLLGELAAGIDPTSAAELRAAPEALARRAVRRWLTGEHPPTAAEVDRVMAVARGTVRATEIGGGRRISRSSGRLRVDRPPGR